MATMMLSSLMVNRLFIPFILIARLPIIQMVVIQSRIRQVMLPSISHLKPPLTLIKILSSVRTALILNITLKTIALRIGVTPNATTQPTNILMGHRELINLPNV